MRIANGTYGLRRRPAVSARRFRPETHVRRSSLAGHREEVEAQRRRRARAAPGGPRTGCERFDVRRASGSAVTLRSFARFEVASIKFALPAAGRRKLNAFIEARGDRYNERLQDAPARLATLT